MAIAIIVTIFIVGYAAITLEHSIKVNKAASALVTGILCWTVYIRSGVDAHGVNHALTEHMGELSGILFFLLGAMVIVELIDAHDGFDIITARALANLAQLFDWGLPYAGSGTRWILPKGVRVGEELEFAERRFIFGHDLFPSLTDADARIVLATGVKSR